MNNREQKPNDDCPCCSGRGTNDDGYGNEGACMTCDGTGKVDPVLAAIAVEEGERCGYVSLYKVRHAYLAAFTDDWRRFMMRHQKKYWFDLFETQSQQHDADRAADKQRIAELESQVPKVVTPENGKCPNCGGTCGWGYCCHCGSKLNWSEV